MKTPDQIKEAISKLEITEQRYLTSVEKFVDSAPTACSAYMKKLKEVRGQISALKWVLNL